MSHSGFSLIELLVTVSILAILVGVGVTLYAHYAEQAACRADEAQVTLIWRTASMMAQERGEMPEELRIDPHHPEDMTLTAADGEPLTGLASAVADSIGPYVFQSKQYTSLPLGTYLVFDGSELGMEEETEETEAVTVYDTPEELEALFAQVTALSVEEGLVADGDSVKYTVLTNKIANYIYQDQNLEIPQSVQSQLPANMRIEYKGIYQYPEDNP